ncbi:MAG TPA: hypothetical protein VHX86_10340 [Tepidisphaeraceae bacterium]|nr:hypothetical protein [Tepidisphaeraceae bacterium]
MKPAPITFFAALCILAGCADNSRNPTPTTRPALMSIPAERGTDAYWLNQPAVASVSSRDYQKLWNACAQTLRNDQFDIDEEDYREGVLTTWPMISKQAFEFWRSDAGDIYEVIEDTLQTIRRSVRFELSRGPDGTYVARPKVLIEQSSHPERRISTVSQAPQAFTPLGETPTRATEQGASIPNRYWYALGRDEAMERELANSVREKLSR